MRVLCFKSSDVFSSSSFYSLERFEVRVLFISTIGNIPIKGSSFYFGMKLGVLLSFEKTEWVSD